MASAAPHLEALDHVVIAVSDLDIAIGDYSRILGRRVAWRGTHPGQGTANALFPLDKTYIELLAPNGEGPVGDMLRQRLDQQGEGLAALAFGTSDVEGFAARLVSAGVGAGAASEGHGLDSETGARRDWRMVILPLDETRGVLTFAIEHASPPLAVAPLDAGADAGCAVEGVDHVVVMTGDVEATNRVYRDTLGLRLALDREFPERGVRLVFFRVGGVTIELGGRLGGDASPEVADSLWGMAYKVDDVDAARDRLHQSGLDVTAVRAGHKKGTRVFTLRDRTHGVATLVIGKDAENG